MSVVLGGTPAENGSWRILKATERSFFVPIWPNMGGGATICISVSLLQILGGQVYAQRNTGDLQ